MNDKTPENNFATRLNSFNPKITHNLIRPEHLIQECPARFCNLMYTTRGMNNKIGDTREDFDKFLRVGDCIEFSSADFLSSISRTVLGHA